MKKLQATLNEVEETQKELRASIEETKRLSEKSDRLVLQHRREVEREISEQRARTEGDREDA